ncbi:hypothetical protein Ptr902_02659 [Pyrenophora tritici-repentis]|nr:hypothetical protein Ptr902_02659 [Pyrenophora tritici-repentis]
MRFSLCVPALLLALGNVVVAATNEACVCKNGNGVSQYEATRNTCPVFQTSINFEGGHFQCFGLSRSDQEEFKQKCGMPSKCGPRGMAGPGR